MYKKVLAVLLVLGGSVMAGGCAAEADDDDDIEELGSTESSINTGCTYERRFGETNRLVVVRAGANKNARVKDRLPANTTLRIDANTCNVNGFYLVRYQCGASGDQCDYGYVWRAYID